VALIHKSRSLLSGHRQMETLASGIPIHVAGVLIVIAVLLPVLAPVELYAGPGQESYSILVVASDLGDVIWANRMGEALNKLGVSVSVEVLYVGADYPGAQSTRSKLSDVGFLWGYSAILIPDLNREFTWGGRLSDGEIDALRLYVEGGHLLMIGLNTYVHSWHPILDELSGVSIAGLTGGLNYTGALDIVVNGSIYRYNSTFGAALVYQKGCTAEAYFSSYQEYPAICVNRFGDGVVVLATFNAVEAVVSQGNGFEIALLLAKILKDDLEKVHPKPLPVGYSIREALTNVFTQPFRALAEGLGGGLIGYAVATLVLLLILYAVILALSLLCLLSRRLRVLSVKPLTKLFKPTKLEQKVLAVLEEAVFGDLEELAQSTLAQSMGLNKSKMCRALSLLEARGLVRYVKLYDRGTYFLRRDEARVATILNPLYRDIADLVSREPGITITEIAARLSIPPDTVLKACREMAVLGIVEVRKVSFEYEVYPLKKPRGWYG